MKTVVAGSILICFALALPASADAAALKPRRVDIEYVAPKSPEHRELYERLKQQRVLEKIRDVLAPLKLPRRLLVKTEGCDGVQNAWYDEGAVTVCYEFLDALWKNVAQQTTPAGLEPIDTLVGPLVDVFLHEMGHATFDLLRIPVLGREEDAADYFSVYIMLHFGKDEARRLILGNAYQYKPDLQGSWTGQKFANEHGTPAQRFYNVLCLAYGADEKLFQDVVDKGYLPKDRADGCDAEYAQVAYAFGKLIQPYIDRNLARRLHRTWLPPVTVRPPYRAESTSATAR